MQDKNIQNATDVIARLKEVLKIRKDIQLAEFLNVRPNTISTWKKRNTLDYDALIRICDLYELDLNEILLGKNRMAGLSSETPLLKREVLFQYTAGTDRGALMEGTTRYNFPFISTEQSMAFQVVGNNMFPVIEENTFVICEKTFLYDVRENWLVVVVSKQKGMFVNRIAGNPGHMGELVLTNENKRYNDIRLLFTEIDEIWRIIGILSYDIRSEEQVSDTAPSQQTLADVK
ncbi:helix-turn-helix domain-containing protein [Flavobacterium sp. HJ-32-4]|uniref:LexA family transcriptional regulator n=2 Tax=unclassified Flavobacterium TaxID=196869 RepID=UPI001F13A37D|nr:helix-turn-helix domain-containing protein [Flavobacterium sp. HJ-32-4]UMY64787.1 helix-turn-helix domain-containing protein [Flavobacterium sp. HJ-32-4]